MIQTSCEIMALAKVGCGGVIVLAGLHTSGLHHSMVAKKNVALIEPKEGIPQ